MTATAAPFGLRPIGSVGGYTPQIRQYPILSSESTRICYGDVVKLTDAGSTTTIQKHFNNCCCNSMFVSTARLHLAVRPPSNGIENVAVIP